MIQELPSMELNKKFLGLEQKTFCLMDPRRISAVDAVAEEAPIEEGKEEEEEDHHPHRMELTRDLEDPQLLEKATDV